MQSDGISSLDKADAQTQAEILVLVLVELPHHYSRAELELQVLGEDPEFDQLDRFNRALDDLIRVGLLQAADDLLLATRAARHFDALPMP